MKHSQLNPPPTRSGAYQLGYNDYLAGYEYRGYSEVPAYLEVDYKEGYDDAKEGARMNYEEAMRKLEDNRRSNWGHICGE